MKELNINLLQHKDIAKAEKIMKAAHTAANVIVSGSSAEAMDRRMELALAIMQTITDREGLSVKDGESCSDQKISRLQKAAV